MQAAGEFLNLEGHHVGSQTKPLYLCGDIEGHKGFDGSYYCLDFARVFPPERLPKDEKEKWDDGSKKSFLFKVLSHPLLT